MAEEIAFENRRISNFQGLVTLTLTLDQVILHTIMHHSSTSSYMPNFIEIEETCCRWVDGRTFETDFIRSTQKSWAKYRQQLLKHLTQSGTTAAASCLVHGTAASWDNQRLFHEDICQQCPPSLSEVRQCHPRSENHRHHLCRDRCGSSAVPARDQVFLTAHKKRDYYC